MSYLGHVHQDMHPPLQLFTDDVVRVLQVCLQIGLDTCDVLQPETQRVTSNVTSKLLKLSSKRSGVKNISSGRIM